MTDPYQTIRLRRRVIARLDRFAQQIAAATPVGAAGATIERSSVIALALDHYAAEHGEPPEDEADAGAVDAPDEFDHSDPPSDGAGPRPAKRGTR